MPNNNRGLAYGSKGENDRAIQDYDRAIQLNPLLAGTYDNRGVAYSRNGNYDRAIQDYDTAIELDPHFALAYYARCESRLILKDWQEAESDFSTAQTLGFDIVSEFINEYGSIPAFEQKHNVKLPASLAQLLTRPKRG